MKTDRLRLRVFCGLLAFLTFLTQFAACSGSKIATSVYVSGSEVLDVNSETLRSYLNDAPENIAKYANGRSHSSFPAPVNIVWKYGGATGTENYRVYLSEDRTFTDAFVFETENKYLKVYNLKIGCQYFYKVEAITGEKTETGMTESFKIISSAPRNIFVNGVENFRDMGGWKTENGSVKQGLIYRSARFNESLSSYVKSEIDEDGLVELNEHLKIKSEIDLRTTTDNETGGLTDKSVIGDNVAYYSCPMVYDENIFASGRDAVRKVFEIFSDQNNLPAVFHCNIGTDRTGFIAYLLNGFLGVSREDLFRDYALSNFAFISSSRSLNEIKDKYVDKLDEYRGDTLKEKIENYLLDCGVSKTALERIREIML